MREEVLITHEMDEDGETPIVLVPLVNSDGKAILYQEDFNKLIALGLDPRWRINQGQVYVRGKKKISIARLILDTQEHERVSYRDKDPLNLRRNNLGNRPGRGTEKTRDIISPATKPTHVTLKHVFNNPSHMKDLQ
jgi:hypothetical protein